MNPTDSASLAGIATGDLTRMVAHFTLLEPVFDTMLDVVFFVKDNEARYVLANRTLAARCGFKNSSALLGKTAEQVFPTRFGRIYTAQDKAIIASGNKLIGAGIVNAYAAVQAAGAQP